MQAEKAVANAAAAAHCVVSKMLPCKRQESCFQARAAHVSPEVELAGVCIGRVGAVLDAAAEQRAACRKQCSHYAMQSSP